MLRVVSEAILRGQFAQFSRWPELSLKMLKIFEGANTENFSKAQLRANIDYSS